jgi:CheY-like chemotaxis protein
LVQAMGGRIGFRSDAENGSTFWFTIPAKLAHEAPPLDERANARLGHPRTDEPILVAEDDPVSRKITARILEKLGYEVHTVSDGMQAVEAATSTRYALIFMDCRMPRVDGLEATRRIRAEEGSSRHTPIIALTADVMSEDRERCGEAGMDGHLAKPIDTTAILDAIGQQLRASRARA